MIIYAFTRFFVPLIFVSVGVSWALGGEWARFLSSKRGVFGAQEITAAVWRGCWTFGSVGAAVGIAAEQHLRRESERAQATARARLLTQLQGLTGSATLPDETRASVILLLEELNRES